MDGRLQVFSGNGNLKLAEDIMSVLEAPLGRAIVRQWPNGESRVKLDENVRGSDIFVIQSLSDPVNHHLIELLVMIDAIKRASASRVTAVIPYYAYAKQEKKFSGREPISASLVADLLETAGVERILTLDLHAPAIEGFFNVPVDHLRSIPILAREIKRVTQEDLVAVSPDAGGVARAEEFRRRSGASLAVATSNRPQPADEPVLEIVGDVKGKTAVIVDDMISSGNTLASCASLLVERGAERVFACAAHPVLAGNAGRLIDESPVERVFVTDTLPISPRQQSEKIEVLTVAPLLAEAIMRIHRDLSISALFN